MNESSDCHSDIVWCMIHDPDIYRLVSIQKFSSRLETFSSLIELLDLQPTKYYSLSEAAESRAMKYSIW